MYLCLISPLLLYTSRNPQQNPPHKSPRFWILTSTEQKMSTKVYFFLLFIKTNENTPQKYNLLVAREQPGSISIICINNDSLLVSMMEFTGLLLHVPLGVCWFYWKCVIKNQKMVELSEDKHILHSTQDAAILLTGSTIDSCAQLIVFTCSPAPE